MISSPLSWSARTNTAGQWMRIDAGADRKFYGVVTQGSNKWNEWVKSYQVQVFLSGKWVQVFNEAGSRTFKGNSNRNTQVQQLFKNSQTTRHVKITPLSWYGHISMRAGLLI